MDWRHRALCRDEDPELFFPIGNTGPAIVQLEEAKAVCRRCPVTEECLSWALESGQDAGIWGGMGEVEDGLGAGYRRAGAHLDRAAQLGGDEGADDMQPEAVAARERETGRQPD